ncbi:MAG: hypothetical protein A2W93_12445 [Bacteroidetes bacterium GWF2_43_63]|nr:MAG: hypothetical protein A2W94_06870 [Bacteroidetes bacterium GWE2_42_42]OFY56475.1 MAG: hypothetical protein A2W93_12445 [Bacteroidetes bacterium GWF2_43_63]HBG71179.1 hypothetical protein [Bacteroidales bacterium]HCB61262.1 hypothetical protein [Bacteroidales bacterium]HCY23279.1 hypothetical protein [Bacteroidales bacterium]
MGNPKETTTMDKYLQDLLERMADRSDDMVDMPSGGRQSNPDATFKKANDEARQINNLEYIEQLKAFIEKTNNEDLKKNAYNVLFYIYSNTGEARILTYCIDRLATEKKEWTLYTILWNIECLKNKIPSDINIDNILALTTYKKHLVRDGAINCLKNADNSKAEDKLIEIITTSTDHYQLTYANATIGTIGTSKSIQHLLKLVENKKQDVAATALGAVLKLSDKTLLTLFIENLEKGKLKYLGLEGVVKYGDKNVVPFVEKRVKELVAKKRIIQFILSKNNTELTVAMNFLAEYSKEIESIRKLYNTLMTVKWELLWDTEKQWLNDNRNRFE